MKLLSSNRENHRHGLRYDIHSMIIEGGFTIMPEGWSKLRALRTLSLATDRELARLYKTASTDAYDPATNYPTLLPLGVQHNAKVYNIARSFGEAH